MTELTVKNGVEAALEFECVEGAHVFFNGAAGEDFYSEWEDLDAETRKAFLEVRDNLSQLVTKVNTALAAHVSKLSKAA